MNISWSAPHVMAALLMTGGASSVMAQEPANNNTTAPAVREQRQEARQQAQENRQETRQNTRDARDSRQDERQQRLQQRLNNRSQYFGAGQDDQFNSWVTRNNVQPMQRVARAANAAVNATESALNSAANLAQRTGAQAAFGFDNPNPNRTNDWFYDHYSLNPTTYSSDGDGTSYGSASRYYDLNNDGVYDSLRTFRASKPNGGFDAYDRVDFAADDEAAAPEANANNANANNADAENAGIEDAKRYTVSGKIFATKTATVNGSKNLIARLSNVSTTDSKDKEVTLVDLGPTSGWKSANYKEGDAITASGPVERVGDKLLLVADTASVGDEKQERISRSGPMVEGQIVDVTKTQIRGKEHTMAIIESESKRQIVDLGPSDKLKTAIEPQTKITVVGVPVRMRNHTVLLAESATIGDEKISIQRW